MSSRTARPTKADRRSFLAAAGAVAAGAGVAGGAFATRPADAAGQASFHLAQGDQCVPLRPLQGNDPVKAFYDYRTDRYSSYGTRSLQAPNTSVLFLYRGPDGVSLVFVHGKLGGNGDGGSITFEITGLPKSGEWVIRDDSYTGPNRYDRWNLGETTASVDWTWDGRRADGGVFGPLGEDTDIEIDPAFNKRAALYGKHYTGTVTTWQALSGDRSDPTRVSLDRKRPLRIVSGTCPPSSAGTETTVNRPTRTNSTATTTNSPSTARPNTTRPTTRGTPTPGGIEGELQGLLDGLSRILAWASRLLARIGRFVGGFSRSIGRYL